MATGVEPAETAGRHRTDAPLDWIHAGDWHRHPQLRKSVPILRHDLSWVHDYDPDPHRPRLRLQPVLLPGHRAGHPVFRRVEAPVVLYADRHRSPRPSRPSGPLEHDGLIAHVFTRDLAEALSRLGKPVVNVSGVLPDLAMPRVMADHEQVGRLAAEHFLDRGLRHFGFFGYTAHAFSIGRETGFRREAGRVGCRVESYLSDDPLHPEPTGLWRWDDGLQQWLVGLPRPVGVLASHDIQGVQISEACRRAGLRVPDDVALLGVDDDDLFCEVARPSLSSVALPGERIGFEAARMLEGLLSGQRRRTSSRTLLLPSPGVVTRQSSDMLAIEDEDVARRCGSSGRTPTGRSASPTCSMPSPSPGGRLERRFRRRWGVAWAKRFAGSAWRRQRACCRGPRCPSARWRGTRDSRRRSISRPCSAGRRG